jgi:hypothetical protein
VDRNRTACQIPGQRPARSRHEGGGKGDQHALLKDAHHLFIGTKHASLQLLGKNALPLNGRQIAPP